MKDQMFRRYLLFLAKFGLIAALFCYGLYTLSKES
jgi:hypothetical protein